MNPNLGRKLRHLSMRTMKKLTSRKPVGELPKIIFHENKVCKACSMGKQTRSSFKSKHFVSTSRPIELLHIDLYGKIRTAKG